MKDKERYIIYLDTGGTFSDAVVIKNDGTFVTVILDRTHLKIISSGKYPDGAWLRSGVAYIVGS